MSPPRGVRGLWEGLVFLEYETNELACRVSGWVAVVADVAWDAGVDGVIASLERV